MTLHSTALISPTSSGEFILFVNSLMIALVLLVLTLKASRIPGNPVANIFFSLCAVAWSGGGVLRVALSTAGFERDHEWRLVAQALQLAGAAAMPIPVIWTWARYATTAEHQRINRWLEIVAILTAAAILTMLVIRPGFDLATLTLHNAAIILGAGAVLMLRHKGVPRSVLIPSVFLVVAACGSSLVTWLGPNPGTFATRFVASHLLLVGAICSFVVFARFRYADVFVKYGVRIVLAGTCTSILASMITHRSVVSPFPHGPATHVIHLLEIVIVANFFLLFFTLIDDVAGRALNRFLFGAADYQLIAQQFRLKLESLDQEQQIYSDLESTVRQAMNVESVTLVPVDSPDMDWPPTVLRGEIVELDPVKRGEFLVPIESAGGVTHVLMISPGSDRPGFVLRDLNFLTRIAQQCGNRLDSLHRQRDLAQRQTRETELQKQIAEAELTALRAQIQPHFLFNSLNTIANLIVVDPAIAEGMTLQLSSVLRHVLANASRSVTTIREEIDFVRTYLSIEEIRFSDRLKVSINLPEELSGHSIPSLILQPLVENALKHGLASKPGPANLWIVVEGTANEVKIVVEDDGLGPAATSSESSTGLGLKNVSQRLATRYQDQAGIRLEARPGGGSRVTMWLPR